MKLSLCLLFFIGLAAAQPVAEGADEFKEILQTLVDKEVAKGATPAEAIANINQSGVFVNAELVSADSDAATGAAAVDAPVKNEGMEQFRALLQSLIEKEMAKGVDALTAIRNINKAGILIDTELVPVDDQTSQRNSEQDDASVEGFKQALQSLIDQELAKGVDPVTAVHNINNAQVFANTELVPVNDPQQEQAFLKYEQVLQKLVDQEIRKGYNPINALKNIQKSGALSNTRIISLNAAQDDIFVVVPANDNRVKPVYSSSQVGGVSPIVRRPQRPVYYDQEPYYAPAAGFAQRVRPVYYGVEPQYRAPVRRTYYTQGSDYERRQFVARYPVDDDIVYAARAPVRSFRPSFYSSPRY